MKNITTCVTAAFAALALFSCTATAGTNDPSITAITTLKDGSSLKGKLLTSELKGSTIFAPNLTLNFSSIKSLTFPGTNSTAKTSLVNGDNITIDVQNASFDLLTVLGQLTIQRDKIRSMSITTRQLVKSPNGLTDGDYCIIDISGGKESEAFPVWYSNTLPEGDEFKTTSIVFKKIPAGSFMMCNKAKVTITKPFFIGVYEVTRKQMQLLSATAANDAWVRNRFATGRGASLAANFICFDQIRGTNAGSRWPESNEVDPNTPIALLREKTGLKIDLPTEAQWEYACRAGTTSPYNNGGDSVEDLKKLGRFGGSGNGQGGDLAIVGSYAPNAWGLYDMHGNVFEWCLDHGPWVIHECSDPVGAKIGESRCLRGGSISYRADECTSDFRYYGPGYPSNASGYFGFRLAIAVE